MNSQLVSTALFAAIPFLLGFGDADARPDRPAALDSARVTYVYTGPNVEFGMTDAEVELNVPDLFIINDVNVLVSITHTWDSDVTLRLESPDGHSITLVSSVGGSEHDFIDTEFDDDAHNSISGGQAPFTGSFRPIEQLSEFNGGSGTGTWTLYLEDVFPTEDDGTLTRWELTLGDQIGGTLRGMITSFVTALPLEGVTVELQDTPYSTLTDRHGRYQLIALEGTYVMTISYPGWCGQLYSDLVLANYDTTDIDAALQKPEFVPSVSSLNLMIELNQIGGDTMRISNNGNCELEWTSDTNVPWLSLHPNGGAIPEGESDVVNLLIDTEGLTVGDYYAEITINHNAEESPFLLPVLMVLVEPDDTDPFGSPAPSDFALVGSFPNPFNSSTTLRFALPQTSTVRLNLFASDGRFARQLSAQTYTAGLHDLPLDLSDQASGVYFAVLNAGSFTRTQKLILIK